MTTIIMGNSKKAALENVIQFQASNKRLKFRAVRLWDKDGAYFIKIEW